MRYKEFSVLIIVLSVVFLNLLIWKIIFGYFPKIANENSVIENTQAVSLLFGFLAFSLASYKTDGDGNTILFLGISLFYLTFFVREIDVDEVEGSTEFWSLAKSPAFLYAVAAAWVAAFILGLFRITNTLRAFGDWILRTEGNLLVAAGLFYVLGDFLEKNLLGLNYQSSIFLEEVSEISATTLMLLCAILSVVRAKTYGLKTGAESDRPTQKPACHKNG